MDIVYILLCDQMTTLELIDGACIDCSHDQLSQTLFHHVVSALVSVHLRWEFLIVADIAHHFLLIFTRFLFFLPFYVLHDFVILTATQRYFIFIFMKKWKAVTFPIIRVRSRRFIFFFTNNYQLVFRHFNYLLF